MEPELDTAPPVIRPRNVRLLLAAILHAFGATYEPIRWGTRVPRLGSIQIAGPTAMLRRVGAQPPKFPNESLAAVGAYALNVGVIPAPSLAPYNLR